MRVTDRFVKMAYGRFRDKYLKFSYFSTISFIILMNVSITFEALSPDYSNVTDSIEPGYLFAKFASKLSALNFRVSRRSNPNTQPDGSRVPVQCKSQLRVNIAREIGPWSSQERGRGGGTREAARASASQPASTVAVIPSSVFNNSQFRQMITSQCKSEIGFPDCYGHKGSRILQKVVADYANFANGWLPNCNITKECANMAERGRTEKWLRSRWTRISTNRSMNLPVCYEMDDLREVSPERVDFWWFDFCCFTGAICNPFTPAGWGKVIQLFVVWRAEALIVTPGSSDTVRCIWRQRRSSLDLELQCTCTHHSSKHSSNTPDSAMYFFQRRRRRRRSINIM